MSVNSTIFRKAKKCNSFVSDSCMDMPFIAKGKVCGHQVKWENLTGFV